MTLTAIHQLPRGPQTDDELHLLIRFLWGVNLPRISVCPNHVSPFEAVAHAYFGKSPGYAVWYASRGSGKSLALAVLGLTKAFVRDIDVTILGGSMTQSKNVAEHMAKLLAWRTAPRYAVEKHIASEIRLLTQKTIRPLPASQTTVRGPHPPLQLLDEVDEMDAEIYNASLGQAMEQLNHFGEVVDEYIVASSTWQNPIGTFTDVIDNARKKGLPVFTWCWRELIKTESNPSGWMSQRFIDQKRLAVSAEMWRTEYELNEPAGTSRAFDLEAIERYFIDYPTPIREEHASDESDDSWVWEDYVPAGEYYVGADWAKEKDKTVIVVIRTDLPKRRLVSLRRMNRRPYPVMMKAFDRSRKAYGDARGRHDGTGLGNVVHDFLDHSAGEAAAEKMVGVTRSQMFSSYITDFENGGYELPRNIEMFYRSHRGATVADVFAPRKWNEHTPDDLVAMALAHKEAGRSPGAVGPGLIDRQEGWYREVDRQFHPVMDEGNRTDGGVTVVDERYDNVGVFNLL